MPECHTKPENRYKIGLQFAAVGLGCLLCGLFAVFFAHKRHSTGNRELVTRQLIPRLTAFIVTALAMERLSRLIEVYLMHFGSKLWFTVVYHSNNVVWLTSIFSGLCIYLTSKLTIAFEQSAYTVSEAERLLLYVLSALIILTLQLLYVLNGIPAITKSRTGQWTLSLIPVFLFAVGLTFMIRVDSSFASRLRLLVVNDAKHKRRIASLNSSELRGMAHRASFAGMRQSSISDWDRSHQTLLVTASKSMVTAVWISVSTACLCTTSALFAVGECEQWTPLVANALIAVAFPMIAVSVSFSLPEFSDEYRTYCALTDGLVRKVVAWQTHREVLDQMRQLPTIEDDEPAAV